MNTESRRSMTNMMSGGDKEMPIANLVSQAAWGASY
jgi:hypothetical protein